MSNISKLPFIKWTGSKRKQAPFIVDQFPKKINIYYEGFVGGGSVMHELLNRIYSGEIECNQIVCSDVNWDLIELWKMLINKNKRARLLEFYSYLNNKLIKLSDYVDGPVTPEHIKKCQEFYYDMRDQYNESIVTNIYTEERAMIFYWIARHAFNGLIRYNNKTGKFNASYHVGGGFGISAEELKNVFDSWALVIDSFIVNGGTIKFLYDSYDNVIDDAKEGDVVYLDPPYDKVVGTYFCQPFSIEQLNKVIETISEQGAKVLLSYDGTSGEEDRTSNKISHWYKTHEYVNSGNSGFKTLKSNSTKEKRNKDLLKDSLYIN